MAIKTSIDAMAIGDKIIARYQGLISKKTGIFSEIGSYPETSRKISPRPNGTEDGGFYFVYVGDDSKGRKLLIGEQNVQSVISWDELSVSGVASKDGAPIVFSSTGEKIEGMYVRLLTGGLSDATKSKSEWNKYIVESPLGNSSAVWNWQNIYSWTSTTMPTNDANRILRGYSGFDYLTSAQTTTAASTIGFRPLLVVDPPKAMKYLVKHSESILKNIVNENSGEREWITLPETVLTKDLFLTHGMTDLSTIPEEAWAELGTDFDILCFKEEAAPLQVKVTTETLYDEVNQRYQGTGKAKVEEATMPPGVKHVLVQAMYENTAFTLVHEGIELGAIEPGVPFEVPGEGTVELYAELTAGVLNAVSLAWM